MNPTTSSKFITLDWDDISIEEAKRRVRYICDNYTDIQKLVLSLSPLSGFHVRLTFIYPHLVAKLRRELKDDGNRLVNDILNRPDNVHDILWRRKNYAGTKWEEKELINVEFTTAHA
jgi:hypothetical protein